MIAQSNSRIFFFLRFISSEEKNVGTVSMILMKKKNNDRRFLYYRGPTAAALEADRDDGVDGVGGGGGGGAGGVGPARKTTRRFRQGTQKKNENLCHYQTQSNLFGVHGNAS